MRKKIGNLALLVTLSIANLASAGDVNTLLFVRHDMNNVGDGAEQASALNCVWATGSYIASVETTVSGDDYQSVALVGAYDLGKFYAIVGSTVGSDGGRNVSFGGWWFSESSDHRYFTDVRHYQSLSDKSNTFSNLFVEWRRSIRKGSRLLYGVHIDSVYDWSDEASSVLVRPQVGWKFGERLVGVAGWSRNWTLKEGDTSTSDGVRFVLEVSF